MNRNTNEAARLLPTRHFRMLGRLTLVVMGVLLLVACGNTATQPTSIAYFTAQPLELGDGSWRLSWDVPGAANVTVNDREYAGTASTNVTPTGETRYLLRAGSLQASVTLAPLSSAEIISDDQDVVTGENITLTAVARAAGSEVPPSQAFDWTTSDADVLSITPDGQAVALAAGTARVTATSRQDSSASATMDFTVVEGEQVDISHFTAQPLELGDGSWQLSWEVVGTAAVDLNGDEQAATGTLAVNPDTPTEYVLRAGSLQESITLAPLTSAVIHLDNPTLFSGQAFSLTATAQADGSDEQPGDSFSWSTSDPDVLSLTEDGQAEALTVGTATITATSLQDSSISATLDVVVAEPITAVIDSFTHAGDSAQLEAGSPLLLEWTVTDADSVEIIEIVTGDVERTVFADLDSASGSLEINLPSDKAEVNYRLTASNAFGEVSQLLLADPLPLPGWICVDAEDVVTIEDPALSAAVWRIYASTYVDPGDGILTCGMVQGNHFTPLPTESDEYGLFEQHNAIIMNRCDQTDDPIVTTLEGIQHLSTLLRLELMCNGIEDVSRLVGLTSLQELNLDRNSVSDLTPLAGLTDLQVLGLYQNEVVDVTPLAGLTELRILYLSENFIKDVSPLSALLNVEHLWLYLNCDDVSGDVPTGCLQDISGLGGLHNLESLVIHSNEINDISVLNADMTRLELVYASHNRISSISSLALPPALSTVRLDTNLVVDISPLAANTGLPSTAEPYYWERIDPGSEEFPENIVSMPINQGTFLGHISLHENCLDTAAPELADQLAQLAGRGADVQGADVEQMTQAACQTGLTSLGATSRPFNPEGLLRQDSRWYRNR